MFAEFLNNILRRRAAKNSRQACVVCPHVLHDITKIKFICRTGNGYAASCNETCHEFETGDGLGMIHLGHVLSHHRDLLNLGGLPINISLCRDGNAWSPRYFCDEYTPVEGDFVAPTAGHHLFDLKDEDVLFVFSLGDDRLVLANLDDGFQILPVWETADQSAEFQMHLSDREVLKQMTFGEIKSWARRNRIRFLGPNFLVNSVDHALIA